MGTSEVHLPEGENLIGFSQRGASLLFSFFLHFCKVTVLYDLSLTALAAAPLRSVPNRAVRDAREIGSFRDSLSFHKPLITLAEICISSKRIILISL